MEQEQTMTISELTENMRKSGYKTNEQFGIKGYKVFNPDWTCMGYQYKVGETFVEDAPLSVCNRGFHFCEKAADCFNYYSFNPENKVAEVLALGEVVTEGKKSCTNKIQIVREIPWAELLEIVNIGKGCSGYCNSGDYNSGNRNSGNRNSGDWNSGDCNSGNRNSGYCNSGDYNSGDYNKCNFSNGCFNTKELNIYLFNKPSEWTYRDWLNSDARIILNRIPKDVLEYVYWENMTDEEKEAHPEAEITGGYLKKLDTSECAVTWWRSLSNNDKSIVTSLPNFDKDIFKEITGIDVDETVE